ncbi:MAG TPA: hypothetical protein VFR41_12680, partial [Acidimicrobiia bacterium]|nr:hypothetical protein [Acidimicrobiia bacterium]
MTVTEDRTWRFAGPNLRDPRLHVAAVVMTVQVLGQTVLHFDISIAQILIALGTCAAIELTVTARRSRLIAWPASALLTGNGVAFVLRVPGTQHGDWWSVRGWWIFAATAAVSLASKYVLRVAGRPLFNPSNIGLVLCFLVLGSHRAEPLDFWWVHFGPALLAAYAVIVIGGVLLVRRVEMLEVVVPFAITFAGALAALALFGHCITARWHVGPVCDGYFWRVIVTSPEVLVFMFFMITDPKTVPHGRRARAVYGASVGLLAVVLFAPQRTEYATKVALLGALVVACAARPLLERWLPDVGRIVWRRRTLALTFVGVLVYGALVSVAGAATREPGLTTSHATGCAGAVTPPTRVRSTDPLPPVRVINPPTIATSISVATAATIVRDTLDDLRLADQAIAERRPELIAAIGLPPWAPLLVESACAPGDHAPVRPRRVDEAIVAVATRSP